MKALFVGGDWHGRVVDIPDGRYQWAVAVMPPLAFDSVRPWDEGIETQLYERRRFHNGTRPIDVFAYGHRGEDTIPVWDALTIAAGLDVRR